MKLDRLEELKKITFRDVLVRNTIGNLEEKIFYTETELEIALVLSIYSFCGNTELHEAMANTENILDFIETNLVLIDELRAQEPYGTLYTAMFNDIKSAAQKIEKFNSSLQSMLMKLVANVDMKQIGEALTNYNQVNGGNQNEEATKSE